MSAMKAIIEKIYETACEFENAGSEWAQAKAQAVEAVADIYGMPADARLIEDLSGLLDAMHEDGN